MTPTPPGTPGAAGYLDAIEIRGLRVAGICGVLPEERERPQPLSIDVDLWVDVAQAGATDDLTHTVDYGSVAQRIATLVESSQFLLLERLAEAIAAECLVDDAVGAATVAVRKLRPPVAQLVDTTGVRITRQR